MNYLSYLSLGVGAWMALNGILHDIFVLKSEHGKKYDRNLLRLLMDGHVLITCGVMQMISFAGLQRGEPWGYYVSGASCISLLIYCVMIFPFLKSIVTMVLNAALLLLLAMNFL